METEVPPSPKPSGGNLRESLPPRVVFRNGRSLGEPVSWKGPPILNVRARWLPAHITALQSDVPQPAPVSS